MARPVVPPGCPLTPHQFQILALLDEGRTYAEIRAMLVVSASTVRGHVRAAALRLGASGCAQAIAVMGRNGWLGWQAPEPQEETATPLALEHPFLAAYLSEFDKWLASGRRSKRARDAMTIALWGHQTSRKDAA